MNDNRKMLEEFETVERERDVWMWSLSQTIWTYNWNLLLNEIKSAADIFDRLPRSNLPSQILSDLWKPEKIRRLDPIRCSLLESDAYPIVSESWIRWDLWSRNPILNYSRKPSDPWHKHQFLQVIIRSTEKEISFLFSTQRSFDRWTDSIDRQRKYFFF